MSSNRIFVSGGGKRNQTIDVIKGYGICLMVCGHSGFPFTDWIYLFHMALFFIVSGYLWNDKNAVSIKDLKKYIWRKICTLWMPFVFINVFFTITFNFFYSIGFYSSVNEKNVLAVDPLNKMSFIKNIISNLLFSGGTQLAGATWFLRSLFCISVVNAIIVYVLKKMKIEKSYLYIMFCLAIVGAILINENTFVSIFFGKIGLQSFFAGYYAFLIGIVFRKINIFDYIKNKKYVLLIICLMTLTILNKYGEIQLNVGHIENVLFYTVTSIVGWILIATVSQIFVKGNKYLSYAGKKSIWILGLHFFSFKIVSYIIVKITCSDKLQLAYYPVIREPRWIWLVYFIVGVSLPLIIEWLYTRAKATVIKQT